MEARDSEALPLWGRLTGSQDERWFAVLDKLAALVPQGVVGVVVDGAYDAAIADRLAERLRAAGRPCLRLSAADSATDEDEWQIERAASTVTVADGSYWRERASGMSWDVVIKVRTRESPPPHADNSGRADVTLDVDDPSWPVIRRIDPLLPAPARWWVGENQAFFGVRAARWDAKFGDDLPAYAAAVAQAQPPIGGTALDLGCGTGRALPALRRAVGPDGVVIGIDVTLEMLKATRAAGRGLDATVLLADAYHLPLADQSVDIVFAAGLLHHLHDLSAGLAELTRVTRPCGRLAVFQPIGRAALAARHGRTLRPDEPLAEETLRSSLVEDGWSLDSYDDAPHRFLAMATRRMPSNTRG